MIDWNRIIELYSVRTISSLCHKWWGIDIRFYDKYGYCKSSNTSLQNPICRLMHSTEKGTKSCLQSCKEHLGELKKSKAPLVHKCNAGLNGIAVPIFAKGKYAGAIVGSGVLMGPGLGPHISKLTEHGLDMAVIQQCYNKLKNINSHIEAYLLDFLKKAADEVMIYYEELQKKAAANKRQTAFPESADSEIYRGIIGSSMVMKKIFDALKTIEISESPVLIEGETGTGKELIAVAINYNSPRSGKTFIALNCSAFSDTLLSSELFGHEKGSFTGAVADKKGLLELANEGTLFLDEIGDMDMKAQAKVLRFLESGTFYRVGGTLEQNVNVRIIAATNRELKMQIEQDLFRKDLFYRINALHIIMPPLRNRKEDIVLLVDYFLDFYMEIHKTGRKDISREVIKILETYDWPGNVRELKSVVERLILISGSNKKIELEHVSLEITEACHTAASAGGHKQGKKLQDILLSFEKKIIEEYLIRANWNKTAVAKQLGIHRSTLYEKITQFSIRQDPPK